MIDFPPWVMIKPGFSWLLVFFIVHWAGNDIKQVLSILEEWCKALTWHMECFYEYALKPRTPVSLCSRQQAGCKVLFSLCTFESQTFPSFCVLRPSSSFEDESMLVGEVGEENGPQIDRKSSLIFVCKRRQKMSQLSYDSVKVCCCILFSC